MCSFLYTTKSLSENDIFVANKILRLRGPDNTEIRTIDQGTIIHNRLKIEGNCIQPYIEKDLILLFNGEIYNYKGSEASYILSCYKEHGNEFAAHLDGEFAILIIDGDKFTLAVDTFKTKPLWVSFENGFHVSTYKSSLLSIGCENVQPFLPNSALSYNIKTGKKINTVTTSFDLKQFKNTYEDFANAFKKSIEKRTRTNNKLFIGLSSGYDSGCIASELVNMKKSFGSYTINNKENKTILQKRMDITKDVVSIYFDGAKSLFAQSLLERYCEMPEYTEYNYFNDISSKPLIYLGYKAKQAGYKIFLSGTGSDEIYGDYYITNSYENDLSTNFKAKYPSDLKGFFPWSNFFGGTMRKYLTKDEYILGSLGIETRYPFLDKELVQEFLWLSSDYKNKNYKAPLKEILLLNNFPFSNNEKLGFNV